MAITRAELTTGSSTTDAATYDSASVTLTAGRLYVIGVLNSDAASETAPSGVATVGGAVTFAVTAASTGFNTLAAPVHWLSAWWVIPGSTVTDAIRITLPDAGTGCQWNVQEYQGMHASAPIGVTGTNTVATANTITLTLPALAAATSHQLAFGAGAANATTDVASGTDWLSVGTGTSLAAPSGFLECAENTAGAATQLTFGTGATNRGVIGLEILVAAAAGGSALPLIGGGLIGSGRLVMGRLVA